jgi:hypothetical protein
VGKSVRAVSTHLEYAQAEGSAPISRVSLRYIVV